MTHNPNTLDLIPGGPHEPAPTGWITPTTPKIEIFDYKEPADPDTDTDGPPTKTWRRTTVDGLKQRLAHARALNAVKRRDKQLRHVQDVTHRAVMANATEWSTTIERARRERTRDAAGSAELAELHRWAARAGERARIRADIQRSAEMRALRIDKIRRYTMVVGIPLMVGFAAISTPGVQKGMTQLLNLEVGSFGWATAWLVEPLLIAIATSIIVVKSVLKMSGGWTDWRADVAKWGALLFSVLLNMLGTWNGAGGAMKAIGEALGHSVGAIGAAVTAWLLGVVTDYASKARPWEGPGVKRLAEMGLLPTVTRDTVTGELVTPTGDAPAVGNADTRQSVTASTVTADADARKAVTDTPAVTVTVTDTPAVTTVTRKTATEADTQTVTIPAVTPTKRHTVTATVTPGSVTRENVTVTPTVTSVSRGDADASDSDSDTPNVTVTPASDAPATDTSAVTNTDADATHAPTVTPAGDADATATPTKPSPSSSTATDATVTEADPLSRDLLDERVSNWTVQQVRDHAAYKARQVIDAGGTKKEGMNEYILTCLALSVLPAGKWAAEAVEGAESAGRTLRTKLRRELAALADADRILLEAHNRIVAEVAAGGDGRD